MRVSLNARTPKTTGPAGYYPAGPVYRCLSRACCFLFTPQSPERSSLGDSKENRRYSITMIGSSVRPQRTQEIPQATPHVSIISSRASNSCPQVVQRMQSDSPVNSSLRIPMPPQSGQRASWTL